MPGRFKDWDTDNMIDLATASSRVTLKTGGTYLVSASVEWAANATGLRQMTILVNGAVATPVDSRVAPQSASWTTTQQIVTIHGQQANAFFEVRVYQSSGAALAISNATFQFQRISG